MKNKLLSSMVLASTLLGSSTAVYAQSSQGCDDLSNQLISENHSLKSQLNDIQANHQKERVQFNTVKKRHDQLIKDYLELVALIEPMEAKYRKIVQAGKSIDILSSGLYSDLVEMKKNKNKPVNKELLDAQPVSGSYISDSENLSGPEMLARELNGAYSGFQREVIEAVSLSPSIPGEFVRDGGNIRSLPSVKGDVVGKTTKGKFVFLDRKTVKGDWYGLLDNKGWVHKSLVVTP